MKKILIIFLLLMFGQNLFAQKVTYKDGTILVDEKPYGYIKKQAWDKFSVQTLGNKEVMFVKLIQDTEYYEVIFRGSGKKAYMEAIIGFGKSLAKILVQKNMLTADGINAEGERYFLQDYGTVPAPLQGQIKGQSGETGTSNRANGIEYLPVQRDRSQPLYFLYEEIKQGTVDIAKYEIDTETVTGGMQVNQVFMLPDGLKVAQANYLQGQDGSIQILTLRDNRVHTLPYSTDKNDVQIAEIIARFLIGRNYL
ncbi:MAG: hypothetical protein MUE85_07325 [Microscillaceae bacterium]|jgi:hypothetical protein|nr:hypothetical protein [Microscillaceae bacterium]